MPRWWLSVVLIACGSSKRESPPPPPPKSDAAVVVIDAPPPIDADPFAGLPPRIEAPKGCMLTGLWKHADQPGALAFAAGGKPYATVFQIAEAKVTFAGKTVFVDAQTKSLRIAGYVDASKARVHAALPFIVAGWVAPGPAAPLPFIAEREGVLTIEVPLPAGVKAKAPVRGDQICDSFATAAPKDDFFARDAIDAEEIDTGFLRDNRTVPLSLEPGKPAVAQLRFKSGPAVDILEKTDKHARIVVNTNSLNPAEDIALVGWVPTPAIEKRAGGFGGSWATGGERSAERGPPLDDTKFYKCASSTPLVVEFGGDRRTVGTLAADSVIEALPTKGHQGTSPPDPHDFVEARLPGAHAELVEGARWLVKQATLTGCAETTRP